MNQSLEPVEDSESLDVELKDLYAANGAYTPEEKIQAVMAYMTTGTSRKASKLCGIPEGTIRWWKARSLWWDSTMAECRKKKQDELDAMTTDVIHSAIGQLQDRITDGDTKFTKEGAQYQQPLSARDLAVSFAILFDKRQLLRGDVTARTEKISERERLQELQKKFTEMAKEVQGFNAKVINDAEFEHIDEDLGGDNVGEQE